MNADATFAQLAEDFRRGTFTAATNRLSNVTALAPGDVAALPPAGSPAYAELAARGRAALQAKQVALVILAGGMATRFGYDQPKGLYPILDGKSFLQLKIEWARAVAPDLPIWIMTSFHTDAPIRAHLAAHQDFGAQPGQIALFTQDRFPRLTPDGALFQPADPDEGFAAPGHGDFPTALGRSGLLDQFLAAGGQAVIFANVDNLGASPEPAIIGWHLRSGCEMTIEVPPKVPGDKGGAPARVNGRVQLVEGFAFPPDFDQDSIGYFNAASYVFSAAALARPVELPWYVVEKQVEGQPVIQFEHLAGDLSVTLSVGLLAVDRDERFIPVKSQDEVPAAQALVRRKLARQQHG